MVMDATQPQQPSPQSVGREFVRQYYTLLNKAPNHLHRFYNNNSSFIHGESTLVIGQKNIHNRIQQLNFHDCHAKISQVDAQATLGNGVVVQVTGELSNDGQPMRRFTQTFVLAAQSPKKYYVHNDIFRYQDMYSDEDNDVESRSENDEEHEQSVPAAMVNEQQLVTGGIMAEQPAQPQQQQVVAAGASVLSQPPVQSGAPQQQPIYYSLPAAGGRPMPVLTAPQGAAVPLGAQYSAGGAGVPPQQVQSPAVAQLNGVVAHEDLLPGMQQPSVAQQQQPLVPQSVSPVVQSSAGIPVSTQVLGSQTVAVVGALPAANTSAAIAGFQQSPLMQQQQTLNTAPAMPSQPPNAAGDMDENASVQTIAYNNDVVTSVASVPTSAPPNVPAPMSSPVPEPVAAPIVDDFKTINEQQQQEKYEANKQQQQQQNEPKTYANLFKSTPSSPSGFVNAAMQQQQQIHQQSSMSGGGSGFQTNTSTVPPLSYVPSNPTSSISAYSRTSETSTMRLDNNMGSGVQGGPLPQRNSAPRIAKEYERRTSNAQQFGDNQQLFLGNIPHHASEEDLKTIFGRFGTVVELRILSKPSGKLPPGMRNPLNYGFITYDDPDSVQNCLANCPIYFPENSPDGQKLNVEEKKPRMRSNDMPPRQSMGNSMSSNMNNAQRNNMGGGPPPRSLSNSGGGNMMRGNNSNMSRGGSGGGGQRMGGGGGGSYNRNENRSGPSNAGPQSRGGNNPQSGGGNYGGRR